MIAALGVEDHRGRVHQLDRDATVELGIVRREDHTHRALAQARAEDVARDAVARAQRLGFAEASSLVAQSAHASRGSLGPRHRAKSVADATVCRPAIAPRNRGLRRPSSGLPRLDPGTDRGKTPMITARPRLALTFCALGLFAVVGCKGGGAATGKYIPEAATIVGGVDLAGVQDSKLWKDHI